MQRINKKIRRTHRGQIAGIRNNLIHSIRICFYYYYQPLAIFLLKVLMIVLFSPVATDKQEVKIYHIT